MDGSDNESECEDVGSEGGGLLGEGCWVWAADYCECRGRSRVRGFVGGIVNTQSFLTYMRYKAFYQRASVNWRRPAPPLDYSSYIRKMYFELSVESNVG